MRLLYGLQKDYSENILNKFSLPIGIQKERTFDGKYQSNARSIFISCHFISC